MKERESKPLNDELDKLIGGNDEYFSNVSRKENKSANFGRNSGLEYKNQYTKASEKLASNKVVDVSAFRKKEEESEPTEQIETIEADTNSNSTEDEDFDKFFDDFLNGLGETGEKEEQEESKEEAVSQKKESRPRVKNAVRKKKRAIDIDIISGGIGGDII